MANKNMRTVKIYGMSGYKYQATPTIMLKGKWLEMNVHHYTDDRHELGVTTVKEGKNGFQIYDMEKTVVDIVFYRKKLNVYNKHDI